MDFDPNKAGCSRRRLGPMQHCRYSPWLLQTRCRQRAATPLRIIHQHEHSHGLPQQQREGQGLWQNIELPNGDYGVQLTTEAAEGVLTYQQGSYSWEENPD